VTICLFCAQTDKVDSSLLDSACMPKSPIKFDKDRLAEFWLDEGLTYSELSDEWKVGNARIEGRSFSWIRDNLNIHPETAKRHVRKLLKSLQQKEHMKVVVYQEN